MAVLYLWSLILAIIVSIPLIVLHLVKMRTRTEATSFPFLALPAELRNMIYEELLDSQPTYPAAKKPPKTLSAFPWLRSVAKSAANQNCIIFANRQIHQEFMDVLCKRATFTLTIDQNNQDKLNLWSIGEDTLKTIKNCEVRIIATSNMLGSVDPRFMPRSWPLQEKVCRTLDKMERLQEMNLHIRAIGDPLWNPLWVWYHASQSFKSSNNQQIRSITFSLDSWSPGENQLSRNRDGSWEWRCAKSHRVSNDPGRWQPIREFCGSLYADCHICHPEEEGED